jgi:hypothetical protein
VGCEARVSAWCAEVKAESELDSWQRTTSFSECQLLFQY